VAATLVSTPARSSITRSAAAIRGASGVLQSARIVAPPLCRRDRGEKVGAAPGLGERDNQASAKILRHAVDGTHRGRGGCGQHPGASLDQVLGIRGGVIRAAARTVITARGASRRSSLPIAGDGVSVTLQLRPHGVRRAGGLLEHASALGRSEMHCTHVEALNSATKSYVSPR